MKEKPTLQDSLNGMWHIGGIVESPFTARVTLDWEKCTGIICQEIRIIFIVLKS